MDTRANAGDFGPNEPESGLHPTPESLAAYIDHRLDDDRRREIEAHLTDCDECLFVVGESSAFLENEGETPARREVADAPLAAAAAPWGGVVPTPRRSPWGRRQWVLAGGGLLAAAAVTVLAVRLGIGGVGGPTQMARSAPADVDELFAGLARRPATSRLAGLTYRPVNGVTRSAAPYSSSVPLATLAAAASVEEAVVAREDADGRWARGLAQLAVGRVDEAIRSLEGALAVRPLDEAIETDLSAACLARVERTGETASASRCLERADRVLARAPTALAARFNRALALEYLGRSAEAAAAWRDYLARDPSSPWADEIRQRHLP
jgi:hypothetical protein